jgi:hypothetical protein
MPQRDHSALKALLCKPVYAVIQHLNPSEVYLHRGRSRQIVSSFAKKDMHAEHAITGHRSESTPGRAGGFLL